MDSIKLFLLKIKYAGSLNRFNDYAEYPEFAAEEGTKCNGYH
jgi:hypothetical protein